MILVLFGVQVSFQLKEGKNLKETVDIFKQSYQPEAYGQGQKQLQCDLTLR
jgi:hypothetical protein